MKLFELLDVIDKEQEISINIRDKERGVKNLYKGLKKKSHIDIMKEALEDLELTIDELKQKGLEER